MGYSLSVLILKRTSGNLATMEGIVMDSQQVELVGTVAFEAELIRQGFEVAKPRRDRGIDLIIYTDDPTQPFHAVPMQLKVSSEAAFSLDRKYAPFNRLVLVYVWHIHTQPRFFCMTYDEAANIIGEKSLATTSWTERGYYSMSTVSKEKREMLEQYENRWEWLRAYLAESVISQSSDRLVAPLG